MKSIKIKSLKNTFGTLTAATVLCMSVVSCGGGEHQKDKDVESFRIFVTELKAKNDEITDNWDEVEQKYQAKVDKIEKKEAELESSLKEEYEQLKKDYAELKAKHEAHHVVEDNVSEGSLNDLYATILTNEGDMDMSGVTSENIVSVYNNFVEIVKLHKNDYTREDWDEVDVLWDALNKRKNELEDNLTSEDKLEIGEEKVEYGACKATNKLPAKSEEKRSVDK